MNTFEVSFPALLEHHPDQYDAESDDELDPPIVANLLFVLSIAAIATAALLSLA